MKKLVNLSHILFSLFLLFSQGVVAQESVGVRVVDNGVERIDTIDLPTSMTYPLDSLLADWKAKNYIELNQDCSTSKDNPVFSDSVYIERLSRMPVVMEMPYNEVVRACIDRYTGKLRNHVAFMLSACNFYMPIFEQALDAYDLPLELIAQTPLQKRDSRICAESICKITRQSDGIVAVYVENRKYLWFGKQ